MKKNKLIELLFIRSWWLILFVLFSFVSYEQSIKRTDKEAFNYKKHLVALEQEKIKQQKENEDLSLMVNSLSDPAWIEMILIRDLGVVPEGKLKVHFTSKLK
jgi:hypothetical protein